MSNVQSLAYLYLLWDQLGDIGTSQGADQYSTISQRFLEFPIDTRLEVIWHWFESQNPLFVVGEVMEGKRVQTSESVVSLMDGKYTIIHDNGVNLRALRHGEPWREMCGDGMILAMAHRIEELELRLKGLPVNPKDNVPVETSKMRLDYHIQDGNDPYIGVYITPTKDYEASTSQDESDLFTIKFGFGTAERKAVEDAVMSIVDVCNQSENSSLDEKLGHCRKLLS